MYVNSRMIGNVGESVAISEFVKMGVDVFIPFGQNTPVDILVLIDDEILKIQVKTTQKVKNGKMSFDLCRTNGFTGKSIPYSKNEVDYIFLYCIENDYKGIVPFSEVDGKVEFTVRVEKTKNNQVCGINYDHEYEFAKWADKNEKRKILL